MKNSVRFTVKCTILLGMLASPLVQAADTTIANLAKVEQRQAGFKDMGSGMKAMGRGLRASELDYQVLSQAAAKILTSAKAVPNLFPAGTDNESIADTEALKTIWQSRDKFDAINSELIKQTTQLAKLIAESAGKSDIAAQAKLVKKQCGACHKDFRVD